MTAAEPPVRGDHRSTWQAVTVVTVLLLAAILCVAALAGAYR